MANDFVMGDPNLKLKRLGHSVEVSVRFAAALTSIKLESTGSFTGTFEDVLEKMRNSATS